MEDIIVEYKRQYIYDDINSLWEVVINMHLAFKKINLQQQPLEILSYFCRYGLSESTVRKLLFDKKVPSRQTVHNAKTTLKKLGLLVKTQNGKKCEWTLVAPLNDLKIDNVADIMVRCKIQ